MIKSIKHRKRYVMKNIVIYKNGFDYFAADTYEKIFEWFRQKNEYERFVEDIYESLFIADIETSWKDLLLEEIWNEIKELRIVYNYYFKKNDDNGMEKISKKIYDVVDLTVLHSNNSVAYFKKCYEEYLEEIPFYD
jgi:hypothetical protein